MPVLTRQYARSADVAYDSKESNPSFWDDSKPTHARLPQEALLASRNKKDIGFYLSACMQVMKLKRPNLREQKGVVEEWPSRPRLHLSQDERKERKWVGGGC